MGGGGEGDGERLWGDSCLEIKLIGWCKYKSSFFGRY